jgi:hypothetical protein
VDGAVFENITAYLRVCVCVCVRVRASERKNGS